MGGQARKYVTHIPKLVAIGTGLLTLACAGYGLYLSFTSFVTAIAGGFLEIIERHEVPYFYPAFYSMLGVTIVCYLVLAWCGLDQLRLRIAYLKLFIGLFVFEILYMVFTGAFLFHLPKINTSIAAASGVTFPMLMPPFFILLPLWAPFALVWAKKRLPKRATDQSPKPLRTEVVEHGEKRSGTMIRSRMQTALVGGIGGAASFVLSLSIAPSFATLSEYISSFTFHAVAFFLASLCAVYSAVLDSPAARCVPYWHCIVVALVALASYFAESFRSQFAVYSLAILPIALVVGILLNGFSLRALKNSLWAVAGSLLGIRVFVVAEVMLGEVGVFVPFAFWITRGFEWYGFTLGLLLSQPSPERKNVASIPAS